MKHCITGDQIYQYLKTRLHSPLWGTDNGQNMCIYQSTNSLVFVNNTVEIKHFSDIKKNK